MKLLLAVPFLVVFILIAGCSTPTLVQGPDGTPHNLVTCLNVADCYNEAARLCQGKYQIIHTANQSNVGGMYFAGQPSRINLLVKCEKSPL